MIPFTLIPYIGADPVTFEMTPADVENVLGPSDPSMTTVGDDGRREEYRGSFVVRYSELDSKVDEITFLPSAVLMYRGHNLFQMDDVIEFLSQSDTPYELVGFVIFLHLGIMIAGFHDNDDSQKSMTVVRKGSWDAYKDDLVPLAERLEIIRRIETGQ